jgi:hypothetical protein
MRILTKMLRQYAVLWEQKSFDPSGQPTYYPPVEIKCRWEEVSEAFVDANGVDQRSNALVFVDRDVKVQSQLWLGRLVDLHSQNDPSLNPGHYAVRKFEKLPTLKATKYLRTCYL